MQKLSKLEFLFLFFLFFLIFSGGNFVYEVAMLLHRDFVDAEQMTMSFFRVGRTGGEAEMSRGGEAVVVDILDLLIWIWLFFLFI